MNTHYQAYANTQTQKKGPYAAFLFVVWPFLATISAFRNFREPWAKNVFWAYCAFFGFVVALGQETGGMDIIGYIEEFQRMSRQSMSVEEVIAYFQQSGEIDILRTALSYILSRLSGNPTVLTTAYAIIFGYFLSRNIWFLLDRLEGKIAPATVIVLMCFFMVNPIWNINGFRMWTAVHVFLYGLLPYLFDGKKSGLWIAASSILVHFSFIVPVGALIGYIFLGNRLLIYFGFYVTTLFISELNLAAFNELMEAYAPEILQERTEGYRSEEYAEATREGGGGSPWFLVWRGRAITYFIMGFLFVLMIKSREFFRENHGWHSLFSFTLLFYGIGNILSLLPSGGRYNVISQLCALALIALYIQNKPNEKFIRRYTLIALPALLLYLVVSFRLGIYIMSATWIMGNPIIAVIFSGENLSLNDVLRMIL